MRGRGLLRFCVQPSVSGVHGGEAGDRHRRPMWPCSGRTQPECVERNVHDAGAEQLWNERALRRDGIVSEVRAGDELRRRIVQWNGATVGAVQRLRRVHQRRLGRLFPVRVRVGRQLRDGGDALVRVGQRLRDRRLLQSQRDLYLAANARTDVQHARRGRLQSGRLSRVHDRQLRRRERNGVERRLL
jgi:hypothetical protein